MCITFFKVSKTGKYRIVLGFNREIDMLRPTRPLDYWPSDPDIIGGQDLVLGGYCLALNKKTGHLAILTNYSELPDNQIFQYNKKSRGDVVHGFVDSRFYELHPTLDASTAAFEFAQSMLVCLKEYNPFNLVVGNLKDPELKFYGFDYFSQQPVHFELDKFHGVSNSKFSEPYPRTSRGLALIQESLGNQTSPIDEAEVVEQVLQDKVRVGGKRSDDAIYMLPEIIRKIVVYGLIAQQMIVVDQTGKLVMKEQFNYLKEYFSKFHEDSSTDGTPREKLQRGISKVRLLVRIIKKELTEVVSKTKIIVDTL